MGIFNEIEKQGFQAAYMAEKSLEKLGSELNQMDIDLIREYVQHLKEKCEKANEETSEQVLCVCKCDRKLLTASAYCPLHEKTIEPE